MNNVEKLVNDLNNFITDFNSISDGWNDCCIPFFAYSKEFDRSETQPIKHIIYFVDVEVFSIFQTNEDKDVVGDIDIIDVQNELDNRLKDYIHGMRSASSILCLWRKHNCVLNEAGDGYELKKDGL